MVFGKPKCDLCCAYADARIYVVSKDTKKQKGRNHYACKFDKGAVKKSVKNLVKSGYYGKPSAAEVVTDKIK